MTHDELLAKIKRKKQEGCEVLPNCNECSSCVLSNALRAVVALHKLQEITLPDGSWGQNCEICDNLWGFCPTLIAITEELG